MGGASTAGTGGGLRRGRGNDRRGASPEAGAASVTMARGKVEALGVLVKPAVLFLIPSRRQTKQASLYRGWLGRRSGSVWLRKASRRSALSWASCARR